jgi:hypothetical protein
MARTMHDINPRGSVIEYRIWGRIEHVTPHHFFVIVSAVPESATGDEAQEPVVKIETAVSRTIALERCADVILRLAVELRAQGHQVIETGM